MRVALMGGGTAGHLFPSVAVAQRLLDDPDTELLFIGAEGRLDGRILSELHYPHQLVPAEPFPYRPSPAMVKAAVTLLRGVQRCRQILTDFAPDAVFGSGGYVSVAGVLAASRLGIPCVCHASDAHPDRANRLLARWATRITTNYEAAAPSFPWAKTRVVGQPVRREFLTVSPEQARAELGIPPSAFVLLVAGGSQGARTLNYAALDALQRLTTGEATHVVHLTGSLDHEDIVARAAGLGIDPGRYRCLEFDPRMWKLIACADLCLTRGGASSLAEIGVMGVPMIIVPYPYAAAHQVDNARPLVESGAALMVPNSELTADWLLGTVQQLRADPARLLRMSEAVGQVVRADAAEIIAETIRGLAPRENPRDH